MSQAGLHAVEVLAERYAEVVRSLTADEWRQPSRCRGGPSRTSPPTPARTSTSSAVDLGLWGTGRGPWRDVVQVQGHQGDQGDQGDQAYAARVLDRVDIV